MKGQQLNKIIFILLLFPIHLFAQPASPAEKDITGLWKGSLYNDTTKKYLPYEIAISEEEGKLNGYSYTLFDIDGKKEMGVKKIKIKRTEDQLTIEDVELISNTYSVPPPRRVRLQSVVYISLKDTSMRLTGKWSTNRTREYLPLTGTLQLERTVEYRPLILFKILTALKLDNGLSFVKTENKRGPETAIIEKPVIEPKPVVADPDKPKEIAAVVPEKKQEVVVEKPAETITPVPEKILPKLVPDNLGLIKNKPSEKLVAKTAINTPGEIFTLVPEKQLSKFVIDDLALIKNKPSEKLVAKTAINTPGEIFTLVPEKKLPKLIIDDLAMIKNKPSGDLFKATGDKHKTITPLTAKKREALVAARKKENNLVVINKPNTIVSPPVTKKTEPVATVKEPAKKEIKPVAEVVQKPVTTEKPKAITAPVITIKEPVKTETKTPVAIVAPPEQKNAIPVVAAAANVSERKMKNEESVFFESDSLVLTLYDNGEVDGDTVSVLMNGQIIFAKQGLSTRANSKTIYIDKSMHDSLSMVMYAENLGTIPPNTGLLIIMDGEKRHEVRFSADLKTNSGILLRRRTKEN